MLRDGSLSCKGAGWMPVSLAALLTTGMIVAYIWSVASKQVTAWLPFISEAGGSPPQSGIFAIFLFLSATIGLLTMLVRHSALYYETYRLNLKVLRHLNNVSLLFGFVCLVGMVVVAAYPVHSFRMGDQNHTITEQDTDKWKSAVLFPHTMGAMFCFVIGLVYAACQSVLSLLLKPAMSPSVWHNKHIRLFAARVFICLTAFGALLAMTIIPKTGTDLWKDQSGPSRAVAEWILALMLVLLFLSLKPEMNPLELEIKAQSPPCHHSSTCSVSHITAESI